jgi:hypothetical protein
MTEIEIANAALSYLGQDAILSFGDECKAARLCKQWYPVSRDTLLREYVWNFAKVSAEAAEIADPNGIPGALRAHFPHIFAYPVDCLRLLDVDARHWKLYGKFICTFSTQVFVTYIKEQPTTDFMDDLFCDACAYKMAINMVQHITGDQGLLKYLEQKFSLCLQEARHVDSMEDRRPTVMPEYSWIKTRWWGPRWL